MAIVGVLFFCYTFDFTLDLRNMWKADKYSKEEARGTKYP